MTAVESPVARPLETHANWTAADVAESDAWTYRLGNDEIAELETALAVARTHTDEVLDVDHRALVSPPHPSRRLSAQ